MHLFPELWWHLDWTLSLEGKNLKLMTHFGRVIGTHKMLEIWWSTQPLKDTRLNPTNSVKIKNVTELVESFFFFCIMQSCAYNFCYVYHYQGMNFVHLGYLLKFLLSSMLKTLWHSKILWEKCTLTPQHSLKYWDLLAFLISNGLILF